MHNVDMIIGKLEEFRSSSKSNFEEIDRRLSMIQKDIHALNLFKSKVYWTVSMSSAFIIGSFEVIKTVYDLGGK